MATSSKTTLNIYSVAVLKGQFLRDRIHDDCLFGNNEQYAFSLILENLINSQKTYQHVANIKANSYFCLTINSFEEIFKIKIYWKSQTQPFTATWSTETL